MSPAAWVPPANQQSSQMRADRSSPCLCTAPGKLAAPQATQGGAGSAFRAAKKPATPRSMFLSACTAGVWLTLPSKDLPALPPLLRVFLSNSSQRSPWHLQSEESLPAVSSLQRSFSAHPEIPWKNRDLLPSSHSRTVGAFATMSSKDW